MERIRALELELSSYKTYAAQRLPANPDFRKSSFITEVAGMKKQNSNATDVSEEKETKEVKFKSANELMSLIDNLTEKNKGLEENEQKALLKFEREYKRKVKVLEETDQIKTDLENQLALIMIENEALIKENQWRKDFNIANAKDIETYVKDIKVLQRKIADLENQGTNWRLKYENQELIKKNVQSNPQFRQTYINMMSTESDQVYKGRLSQVVKENDSKRFTERERLRTNVVLKKRGITTNVNDIKEETDEGNSENSDNLGNELDGLDQMDFGDLEERPDGDDDQIFDIESNGTQDGIIRASELDNDRFTVMDKERSSHINIGVTARTFQKQQLPAIEEDEFYDPVKDKLVELKKQTDETKIKVMETLEDERQPKIDDFLTEVEDEMEVGEDAEGDEESKINVETIQSKPIEPKIDQIKEVVRSTIAPLKKITTTANFGTQTETKVEKVTIDNTSATVIYNTPITDYLYEVKASEGVIKTPNETPQIALKAPSHNYSRSSPQLPMPQSNVSLNSNSNQNSNDLSSYKMSAKTQQNPKNNVSINNDRSESLPTVQYRKTDLSQYQMTPIVEDHKQPPKSDLSDYQMSPKVNDTKQRISNLSDYKMSFNNNEDSKQRISNLSSYTMTTKVEDQKHNDSMDINQHDYIVNNDMRMMTRVQDGDNNIILRDRHNIVKVETSNQYIQTDHYEVASQNSVIEKSDAKPVGEDYKFMEELDESEDEEQDDQNEDQLFQHIDSRQKDLGVIHEEDNDESSTFKTIKKDTEKANEDEKKNQEIANIVKDRLQSQVKMSKMSGRGQSFLRDQSIINKISKIRNFDFLALRSKENKNYKRISRILERYDEKPTGVREGTECFTEYIKKIDTSYKRHKRKILITSGALYQLSKNYSVVVRVPLENIKAITLIK